MIALFTVPIFIEGAYRSGENTIILWTRGENMVLVWGLIGPIQTFTCTHTGSELISSTPQTDWTSWEAM